MRSLNFARYLPPAGIFFVWLAGCATPGRVPLSDAPGLPPRIELAEVPYHPQQDYHCGPAALAMALAASGRAVAPEQLAPQVYVPGLKGSLQAELAAAARRHGRLAHFVPPALPALLEELAAGTPVLVLQNLGLDWYPVWHYAVVIGYDLSRREFILRSGSQERTALALSTFDRTWERAGRWGLAVLPPDRLPANAQPAAWLEAAAALERAAGPAVSRAAYETAALTWPEELAAWMGLGNAAHALGDREQAERAFREAVTRHPGSGAAHNNLAQVLAERGRLTEAAAFARQAVALGGPHWVVSRRTLEAILARSAR